MCRDLREVPKPLPAAKASQGLGVLGTLRTGSVGHVGVQDELGEGRCLDPRLSPGPDLVLPAGRQGNPADIQISRFIAAAEGVQAHSMWTGRLPGIFHPPELEVYFSLEIALRLTPSQAQWCGLCPLLPDRKRA